MPHLIPAAADPTASVGNVRSLTAVGDSDSFLSLSPILLISNHPLFPLTSLFPLQIFESYVGWWLLMMGNTDNFLLFSLQCLCVEPTCPCLPPDRFSLLCSISGRGSCPVPYWCRPTHPAPLYQCVAPSPLVLMAQLQSNLKGCQPSQGCLN